MMKLPTFKLEEYLGQWEFKAPYLLCNSDMETLSLKELLEMADPEGRQLWENLRLSYTEVSGLPVLLQEIQKLYNQNTSTQILSFAGAEEGIYAVFNSLLTAGDHVIVVTPCYQSLESIPSGIGCPVTKIPLNAQKNWKLDVNLIEKSIRPNTKLIAINFPHNPTGAMLDIETLNSLVSVARRYEISIFSDEVYRFMEIDPNQKTPPMADLYEKGISLGVMSKGFGLAGLRIGWIASQDTSLIKQAGLMKHYLSICNSAPSEVLALIALRAQKTILGRSHEIMTRNLSILDEFFDRHSNLIRWNRPQGGCIGFPELIVNQPIEKIAADLVQETGVLIMPGNIYDWSGNHFRIGFGRKNMPEALERFGQFIQKYGK